ncbi:MAG: DUF58 domain-containing protein [Planctomycetota bacterium]|jgi:uncharacterized protein (DUF58 family)|nr:DUF58 domain-containing protein [Planctomycetia bacterium]RLS65748.1 MAG: DUF58 domain-containing protein [Planctomycetota bacterium]
MRPTRERSKFLDAETLQKIGSLDLIAREVVEGLRVGVHKSPLHGFSTEFVHHRQYAPGDNLRHIDWRVYGRTQRYYVKLYEAETNFDANLLLDASSSMRYGSGSVSKLEYAKYMIASLAYLIVHQHDSVGLGVFDSKLRRYLPPSGSPSIVHDIAHELEITQPEPRTDIADLLHQFALRLKRRGLVMLFSDLFDDIDKLVQGLEHLRFGGHNVAVFHILDPAELTFPFSGTCKFKGLEGVTELLTEPRRVQEAYLAELKKMIDRIRNACERAHVDYVLVDTSRPVDEVLSAYLISRSRGV